MKERKKAKNCTIYIKFAIRAYSNLGIYIYSKINSWTFGPTNDKKAIKLK